MSGDLAAAPRPSQGSEDPGGRGVAGRTVYLDNLKVLLIAAVIVVHAVLGYVAAGQDGWWPYANVQETAIGPFLTVVLFMFAAPFAVLLMALLFLVAGLLTPPSIRRKGPRRFVRDRLLRLGLPFAAFTLLLWPVALYAMYRPLGHVSGSYGDEFADEFPDTGPLWFVGLLLLFSLGYAGWYWVRHRGERAGGRVPGRSEAALQAAGPSSGAARADQVAAAGPQAADDELPAAGRDIGLRWLLLLTLGIAACSFAIRLVLPYGTQTPIDLNEWQWPECLGMFVVGIVAVDRGWRAGVPDVLARRCGNLAGLTFVAAALLAAVAAFAGVEVEDFVGGWHAAALVFACFEGVLTVFGSIWLLRLAQRHLDRPMPLGRPLARSAYLAFLLQGFVLLGLAVAMRWVPAPAELKALTVAVLGLAGSFGLAWLLISRVPGLSRVL